MLLFSPKMETRVSAAHALSLVLTCNVNEKNSKENLENTFMEWSKLVSTDISIFEKRDGAYLGIGFLAGCVLNKFGDSWANVVGPGFLENAFFALSHGIEPEHSSHLESCCVALSEATKFCFSLAHFESQTISAATGQTIPEITPSSNATSTRHTFSMRTLPPKLSERAA